MTTKDIGAILQRFNALYTFYTPAWVENQKIGADFVIRRHEDGWFEDRGYVMRVLGTSYTVSENDWITVHLGPFGRPGRIPVATLPATFEGSIPVHYHCERQTPLAPEELVFHEFADLYSGLQGGMIEGGDGAIVQLGPSGLSCDMSDKRVAEYGCPAGEVAILVDSLPSTLDIDTIIREFPHMAQFPLAFKGLKIYYKRGEPVVPH